MSLFLLEYDHCMIPTFFTDHPNQDQFAQYMAQWKQYEQQMEERRMDIESRKSKIQSAISGAQPRMGQTESSQYRPFPESQPNASASDMKVSAMLKNNTCCVNS